MSAFKSPERGGAGCDWEFDCGEDGIGFDLRLVLGGSARVQPVLSRRVVVLVLHGDVGRDRGGFGPCSGSTISKHGLPASYCSI
jgi:hypothetical protein